MISIRTLSFRFPNKSENRPLVFHFFPNLTGEFICQYHEKNFISVFSQLSLSAQTSSWFSDVTDSVGLGSKSAFRINVSDLNNDDYPDLVIVEGYNDRGLIRVYLNEQKPGSSDPTERIFVDFTDSSGVNVHPMFPDSSRRSELATIVDVDNDGDNDLVTGIWHWSLASVAYMNDRPAVLLNDGTGRFTHVVNNGFDQMGLISISGFAFTDYDQDGNIDCYVSTFSDDHPNTAFRKDHLMRGNGDGTFQDVTSPFDIGTVIWPMYGVSAGDWNNDGYNDIFTSPYCRSSGTLWQGSPYGYFTDVSLASGYDAQFMLGDTNRLLCQWGAFPYDYDNDGDLDVLHVSVHGGLDMGEGRSTIANNDGPSNGYRLNWDLSRLQRNNPQSSHLGNMDATWFDIDNDMLVDLMMTENSYQPATDRAFFFYQDSTHYFEDVTGDLGLLWIASPHSVESFDYDLDGDYDLLMNLINNNNAILVLENEIGQDNHWVTVKLEAPAGVNQNCIGARVYVTAGGVTQFREIQAGVGHFTGQQPFALTFGLADNENIDSLIVRWPNNAASPTVVYNPCIDTMLTVNQSGTACVLADRKETVPAPEINVYPNPAREYLLISGIELESPNMGWVLSDLLGRKMNLPSPTRIRNRNYRLDVSQIPAGVYVLVVGDRKTGAKASRKVTIGN